MTLVRYCTTAILAGVISTGCKTEERLPASSPPLPAGTPAPLDTSALLKHKMECRTLGVQAEREQFPGGKNTIDSVNQGFLYFDSEYAYDEKLNTCVMLSGFQLTNLKTRELTTYQATVTDLLSNKMLGTYLVLGGRLSPASIRKAEFVSRARELFGEPLPRWLEQAAEP